MLNLYNLAKMTLKQVFALSPHLCHTYKYSGIWGLLWRSSGYDSMHPLQGVYIVSGGRIKISYAMQYGHKKKKKSTIWKPGHFFLLIRPAEIKNKIFNKPHKPQDILINTPSSFSQLIYRLFDMFF